jgi:NAD(P)-dependent dehydrogenase (short-subunit alcohol dehydrogenase family)
MSGAKRLVLITGGGAGLGRVLAITFADAGYPIAICGRNEKALETCASGIEAKGGSARYFICDIRKITEVEELGAKISRDGGLVQVLINNAGVARAAGFLETSESLWDETQQTNLTGARNCCKVFLPGMLQRGWGRILNIASTMAKVGSAYVTAYAASKHGMLGLTRSLALETARCGVTVNAICPGYLNDHRTEENARVMAERTGKTPEAVLAMFAASAPQNRLIEPEEVAALALLLAGDKCGAITGQAINVDGGAVMV